MNYPPATRHIHRPGPPRPVIRQWLSEALTWLCKRGLIPRNARPGIESGERLARHRWKTEQSVAGLFGSRRTTIRTGCLGLSELVATEVDRLKSRWLPFRYSGSPRPTVILHMSCVRL
ncbi:hypothetical protein GCM10010394_48200 [Streptomyces crystallinus]|uniref:Transposase n=1 Tax=Streptomyces crystallinus TaxID=68191 RepID=A0ABP3RRV1_9ACTN